MSLEIGIVLAKVGDDERIGREMRLDVPQDGNVDRLAKQTPTPPVAPCSAVDLLARDNQAVVAGRVSRSVVLVTGVSGTGKSTVLAALARRGHRVVDTDDHGWIVDVETPDGIEPVWDLDRVRVLLDGHRQGFLFVSGCVANQRALYDRFDAVVLLSRPSA